ncbi:multidrug and toxin extrusion protein 1-like [Engraulis encrasicolus]|uniref:multidrug and toxin extrusion protein 1-like n=1 Tax=Engraulis encrasicolus TaxID=184585 RepID=UPI002FD67534
MAGSDGRAKAGSSLPEEPASSRLFCCSCVRRWIPLALREEIYHILLIAAPLLLYRVLNFCTPLIVTGFSGNLGKTVLAGYAMSSVILNVTAFATGGGLILACNTLVSQTFGARNLLRVGVILQRSILILLLFCLPCWALLVNTRAILLVLGQEPEVARIAQMYVMAMLPAIPAHFLHLILVAYLQNQGVILPQVYMSAVTAATTLLMNYTFVTWLDFGIPGSIAANSLAQFVNFFLLLGFIVWRKLHIKTWDGWSMESLQEWGSFMKLAVPSTVMFSLEWWVYEFGAFFAGMLGEDDLAAQHIVMMLAFLNYMVPLSVQGATCVRVGNALGAGDTAGAIRASRVGIGIAAVLAVFQGAILASAKTVIAYIFTSEEKIALLVSGVFTIYCLSQFFDGLVCVSMGVLLGAGRQRIAAVANLFGYYCIGLPSGIGLMFAAGLHVAGFWLGLLISVCVQVTFFFIVISKMNWKTITKEAVARAGKNASTALMADPDHGTLGGDKENQAENGHGSSNLSTQEVLKPPVSEIQQQQQPAALFSSSQLLLRRGLTTLAALLILAVGISVHLLMPLPESSWSSGGNATMDDGNWTTTASPLEQSTLAI